MATGSQESQQPVEKRIKNFKETTVGYSKRVALEEARRCPQVHDASRHPVCPLGVDILAFIRHLREGDVSAALEKILEENRFPAICGRVCPAPCEQDFVRRAQCAPVCFRSLERFAADYGRVRTGAGKGKANTSKTAAVIGSGPAGLMAAAILAGEGVAVTVFETLPEPGGVLRYGIPVYRLPRQILDGEIERLKAGGVVFHNARHLCRPSDLEDLCGRFSAVLIAAGTTAPENTLPGEQGTAGIYMADELLLRSNTAAFSQLKTGSLIPGEKVAVLGSNSEALDCARICRRIGKETTVVFPQTEEDFDANPRDTVQAREEGVRLEVLTEPVGLVAGPDHRVQGVRCRRMDFAGAGTSGAWQLKPVPDSEFVLDCDAVVIVADHRVSGAVRKMSEGLRYARDGRIRTDPQTSATSRKGVFAAGDVAGQGGSLIDAFASGKKAAANILEYIHSL